MLHIEIRNEACAYKVDHSVSPDRVESLLCENDGWKIIPPDNNDTEYKLISEGNKWKIIFGKQVGVGGNPDNIPVQDLFTENDNILGLVIALFNAAPGQQYLKEFSNEVSNVSNEQQLADSLAAHPKFTREVIGGKSPAEQVTEMMNHFGLIADGVPGSAASDAKAYFIERIDSHVGFGAIAAEATFYLLRNDLIGEKILAKFDDTSKLFKLKIFVADNYSEKNPSTDLTTLQKVVSGITFKVFTERSEIIEGDPFGGLLEPLGGGDRIFMERSKIAREVYVLKKVSDTQIFDTNWDGITNILKDGGNSNLFFDVVSNFSAGTADTDDRIDLTNFNFTGTQLKLLDVSSVVSIATDLTSVLDLFSDEAGVDHGLAFLKHSIGDVTLSTTTYLFIDVNKDGDFTSADDMFLELKGVDDLVDANFIYYSGVSFFPVFTLTAPASVTEGDSITYTVTASEAVAANTDVVFKVIPSGIGADQGTTDTNENDFIEGALVFNPTAVTIPAGQTTATFSITASNDGLTESVESFVVNAVVGNETLTTTTNMLDGQSGSIFDLTTSEDLLLGSDNNDVFNGFVGNAFTSTLTSVDIVDGWIGIDTFNIINASGTGLTITNGAGVSGIEIFNLRGLTAADTIAFVAAGLNGPTVVNGSLSLGALTVTDNTGDVNIISTGVGNDVITLTDNFGVADTKTVKGGAGADAITTNLNGNIDPDSVKFVYSAGDSVSDSSTTGISATLTDTISNLDGNTLSETAGSFAEFDTEVPATAVTVGSTDVVLGTTTVANAADFFVNIDSSSLIHIYQDTDGDKIIEAGEFAVSLTGIQIDTIHAADFTVSGGDLMLMTT